MNFKSVFVICSVLCLSACGTAAKLDSAQNNFANGNYEKLITDTDANNLDILIGAHGAFQANDYSHSDDLFEEFNARKIDSNTTSIFNETAKLAAGNMVTEYKPYMMDHMFVFYYQLWDALLSGRFADARVIINQSYDRQKKMSIEYKKLISKRQSTNFLPDELQSNLVHWNAYSDIMNPALTYLSGLYYLNIGEFENARQFFARSLGMMPKNTFIKSDLRAAEDGLKPENTVWIFIETGFAPRLHEEKINIPWSVDGEMQVISVALANPVAHTGAVRPANAQLLTDVDAMFTTEFKEYQVNNVLRAITKAIANYATQVTAKDKMGDWGTLLGAVYTVATTSAEIRSWVTLPQSIYLIRTTRDKTGLIKLNSGDTLELIEPGNYIIHIRGNDIKTLKIK